MDYDFRDVEARWQGEWERSGLFRAPDRPSRPKFYALEMFAYPSGDLHLGHFRNYTLGDTVARVKLMQGYDVMHPFGWDAFGLPAENAAIKNQLHPAKWTLGNIAVSRATMKRTGVGYDWDREIVTCRPDYYRWNQWFFLLLWRKGLAYRAPAHVNWCPSCATVLANEQVKDGACERCDTPVERKFLTQWFFRITAYAERLLDDLALLERWPAPLKLMQTNWIGRSVGAEIVFELPSLGEKLPVFTTRPDTVCGVTFMAVAPESALVERLIAGRPQAEKVREYVRRALRRTEQERTGPEVKEGLFTGAKARNPVSGQEVPIWVADYVLGGYGTGAVMGVPAHDERDFLFARQNGIAVRPVIHPGGETLDGATMEAAYTGEGVLRGSGRYDGLPSREGARRVVLDAEAGGYGRAKVQYRLRDWLISRQRYWGTPIPVIHCPRDGMVAVPEKDLPVILPEDITSYQPKGRSPLADSPSFMKVKCPTCGGDAERDADTMDTFVDSSWYYLRYLSPQYEGGPFEREAASAWLPVDQYIGGATHATGHLIFFRFFHKVLFDEGWVKDPEPATGLFNHGMVLDAEGVVMSKSKGNVTSPIDLMNEHGSDVLRVAMMFAAPPDKEVNWTGEGIPGAVRFLRRSYRLVRPHAEAIAAEPPAGGAAPFKAGELTTTELGLYRKLNRTMARVARDLDSFRQNTAIAALMDLLNDLEDWPNPESGVFRHAVRQYVRALAPVAPHLGEEMWRMVGGKESAFRSGWLTWDASQLEEDVIPIVVQVNGKLRGQLHLPRGSTREVVEAAARADGTVERALGEATIRKVIHVPDKLVNFVVGETLARRDEPRMTLPDLQQVVVFIASPGDVGEEREAIRNAIGRVNRILAKANGFLLEGVGWEDIPARKGERAQEVINPYVDAAAIFIGVFNRRFGSRTGIAESGTEEEYERISSRWELESPRPDVQIYFRSLSKDELADPDEELRKVLAFKQRIAPTDLYREFSTIEQITQAVELALSAWVHGHAGGPKGPTRGSEATILSEEDLRKLQSVVVQGQLLHGDMSKHLEVEKGVETLARHGLLVSKSGGWEPSNSVEGFAAIAKLLLARDEAGEFLRSAYFNEMLKVCLGGLVEARFHCRLEETTRSLLLMLASLSQRVAALLVFGDTGRYDATAQHAARVGKTEYAEAELTKAVVHRSLMLFGLEATEGTVRHELWGERLAGLAVSVRAAGAYADRPAFVGTATIPLILVKAAEQIQAGQLVAGSVEHHIVAGTVFMHMEEYELALKELDTALRRNLTTEARAAALNNKGTVLWRLGRESEALELFEAGLEMVPNQPELLGNAEALRRRLLGDQ